MFYFKKKLFFFFTFSLMWTQNIFHTNELFSFWEPSGRLFLTLSIHNCTPASPIQPFSWTSTKTPGGNFIFGVIFRLNIIMGFNSIPLAKQLNTTVNLVFSWPVLFKWIFFLTFWVNSCIAKHIDPYKKKKKKKKKKN